MRSFTKRGESRGTLRLSAQLTRQEKREKQPLFVSFFLSLCLPHSLRLSDADSRLNCLSQSDTSRSPHAFFFMSTPYTPPILYIISHIKEYFFYFVKLAQLSFSFSLLSATNFNPFFFLCSPLYHGHMMDGCMYDDNDDKMKIKLSMDNVYSMYGCDDRSHASMPICRRHRVIQNTIVHVPRHNR